MWQSIWHICSPSGNVQQPGAVSPGRHGAHRPPQPRGRPRSVGKPQHGAALPDQRRWGALQHPGTSHHTEKSDCAGSRPSPRLPHLLIRATHHPHIVEALHGGPERGYDELCCIMLWSTVWYIWKHNPDVDIWLWYSFTSSFHVSTHWVRFANQSRYHLLAYWQWCSMWKQIDHVFCCGDAAPVLFLLESTKNVHCCEARAYDSLGYWLRSTVRIPFP